ncbi:helix-turn-helix transcriptional regulator [Epilithonimonas arachidiradicis]|nr:AraC family transcriptional regulator [Epilithonimonas arachidiradicis]
MDSFLFYNISKPVNVTYEEPRNELTIYFKPLAIFHFFPEVSLSSTADHLENFKPYPDYQSEIQDLLKMNNKDEQANILENYLISKLFSPKLEMIQDILQKAEEGWKLNDIAESMGISRQYLHRTFLKYMGKSPSLYKRIHRFRQVTSSLQTNEKFISLSHENSFFDQPHFNREFKALTGVVPTIFFKNINDSKDMLWLFV